MTPKKGTVLIYKRHHWKSGWCCERCGLNRVEYEDSRKQNKRIDCKVKENT
jgi:hypothetical protein